jgi:hypothetical protein
VTANSKHECDNDNHAIGCQCPGLPPDYYLRLNAASEKRANGIIAARIKAVRHFCQDQIIHYGKGDSATWVAQGVVNILDGNIDNQLDWQEVD